MLKLSKDQKEALKSLVNHPWWDVLELLVEDSEVKLWKALLSTDLTDTKNLDVIKKNQIFVEARRTFINNVKKHSRDVINPIDQLL